jgi:hypothetical protein
MLRVRDRPLKALLVKKRDYLRDDPIGLLFRDEGPNASSDLVHERVR